MPTIQTLGHPSRRTTFSYSGNITQGVIIEFKNGTAKVSGDLLVAILQSFRGKTIPGGFNMTDSPSRGLGKWVLDNSEQMNTMKLTPRHASFIAAILVHETEVKTALRGNAVYLTFP